MAGVREQGTDADLVFGFRENKISLGAAFVKRVVAMDLYAPERLAVPRNAIVKAQIIRGIEQPHCREREPDCAKDACCSAALQSTPMINRVFSSRNALAPAAVIVHRSSLSGGWPRKQSGANNNDAVPEDRSDRGCSDDARRRM